MIYYRNSLGTSEGLTCIREHCTTLPILPAYEQGGCGREGVPWGSFLAQMPSQVWKDSPLVFLQALNPTLRHACGHLTDLACLSSTPPSMSTPCASVRTLTACFPACA